MCHSSSSSSTGNLDSVRLTEIYEVNRCEPMQVDWRLMPSDHCFDLIKFIGLGSLIRSMLVSVDNWIRQVRLFNIFQFIPIFQYWLLLLKLAIWKLFNRCQTGLRSPVSTGQRERVCWWLNGLKRLLNYASLYLVQKSTGVCSRRVHQRSRLFTFGWNASAALQISVQFIGNKWNFQTWHFSEAFFKKKKVHQQLNCSKLAKLKWT